MGLADVSFKPQLKLPYFTGEPRCLTVRGSLQDEKSSDRNPAPYPESFRSSSHDKFHRLGSVMVQRPRTKLHKKRSTQRCPKCGTIVMMRVRCKVCHKKLR